MAIDWSIVLRLALVTLPWVGVQAIWQTEFNVVTEVMKAYGLGAFWSSNIWIFGPITGFFTAPIIGNLSDRSTSRWGRRRPFLLGGLISTITASLIFAFSNSYSEGAKLPVSFISYIVLDVTINVMQTPLRAFASDMAPADQQFSVQMFAVFFQGIGSIAGNAMYKNWYHNDPADLPRLILGVMAVNLVLILAVCFFLKEEVMESRGEVRSILSPFRDVAIAVTRMEKKIAIVCAVEFFSWAALFLWWPVSATWWSVHVFKGCDKNEVGCTPEQYQAYKDAPQTIGDYGIYQNVFQTVLSIFFGTLLFMGLLRRVKFLWSAGLAIGAVFLILAKFGPQTIDMAKAVTICVAIPISAINSFPFAIVGNYQTADGGKGLDTGLQMGLLNLFICAPQLIITFAQSAMQTDLGPKTAVPWVLFLGGVMWAIGSIIAIFIIEKRPRTLDHESGSVDVPVSETKKI
ncbi:hypothetical protein HK104_006955 [Borealophlyctis nickersoniae]|nr:hypothetical protein HK104_006955 [Borealophlyctis nickersoniae]